MSSRSHQFMLSCHARVRVIRSFGVLTGLEGGYKHYQNFYSSNSLALNKHQHNEEKEKRRHMSHKFSLTPSSEFVWSGSTHGSQQTLLGTLRASMVQLESRIPAPFLHPSWPSHRSRWIKMVNACRTPDDFGSALAMFEACVKPVVFNQVWNEALGWWFHNILS